MISTSWAFLNSLGLGLMGALHIIGSGPYRFIPYHRFWAPGSLTLGCVYATLQAAERRYLCRGPAEVTDLFFISSGPWETSWGRGWRGRAVPGYRFGPGRRTFPRGWLRPPTRGSRIGWKKRDGCNSKKWQSRATQNTKKRQTRVTPNNKKWQTKAACKVALT